MLTLLDERTAYSETLRFKKIGVAGILLEAKTGGLIKNVQPHLDALRQQAGFYLSEVISQSVLTLANEIQEDS